MNSKRHLLPAVAALMLAGTGFTFLRPAAIAPKGYVIAEITVTDPEAYKSYVAAVGPLMAHFGSITHAGGEIACSSRRVTACGERPLRKLGSGHYRLLAVLLTDDPAC